MFAKRVSFVAIPAAVVLGFIGFAPPTSAAPNAEVTLNFVGLNCQGCTITYAPDSDATGTTVTIKNGSATFTSDSGPLQPGYFSIDGDKKNSEIGNNNYNTVGKSIHTIYIVITPDNPYYKKFFK